MSLHRFVGQTKAIIIAKLCKSTFIFSTTMFALLLLNRLMLAINMLKLYRNMAQCRIGDFFLQGKIQIHNKKSM